MTTTVPQSQFLGPVQLGAMPCVASSRLLVKVPESVQIINCCQDANNPSLVIVTFQLAGVYDFTPTLKVIDADGQPINQVAPLALNHFSNAPLPLQTNCTTITDTLVYDLTAVVPDFLSVLQVTIELTMTATPASIALLAASGGFQPQPVSHQFLWNKGILPKPINMAFQNGQLRMQFEYGGQLNCACNVTCITPSGVTQEVNFCPNQRQTITVNTGPLTGEPTAILLQYQGGSGNITSQNIQALINVTPRPPTVANYADPRRLEIGIDRSASNGAPLDTTAYQIWRYEDKAETSAKIWKDWSTRPWTTFTDDEVIEGRVYGYAVMYKGQYGEVTRLSKWTQVTA